MLIITCLWLVCIIFSQRITAGIHGNSVAVESGTPADEVHKEESKTEKSLKEQKKLGQKSINGKIQQETENIPCRLIVRQESKDEFTNEILEHKYNFVYLKLNFINFTMNETKYVINTYDWVWTYKGEDGAYQYLFLPMDYGYSSLGLLWTKTRLEPFPVGMYHSGDCSNLVLGEPELKTNYLIGHALANMTSDIALHNELYNSSYWCYNQRVWLFNDYVYFFCKNSVCTFQTFGYNCCKFNRTLNGKVRSVECGIDHYEFGKLWWMFPIIIGNLCFAFYPILLSFVGIIVNRLTTAKIRKGTTSPKKLETVIRRRQDTTQNIHDTMSNSDAYIPLKNSSPITFMSTLCSPLYRCCIGVPIIGRLLRISIIILPMVLSTSKVILDYVFAKDLVKDTVRKGALLGFSSLISDLDPGENEFLFVFGGVSAALSVYVVFGCILIIFPSDLEKWLENGLPGNSDRYVSLFNIPLKQKERLSGIRIRSHVGYKKMHTILLAQIFMLLSWKFWWQALRMFYVRWQKVSFPYLATKLSVGVACLLSVFILPVYIVICFIELVLSVLFFAFPTINCFWIVIKAVCLEYFKTFESRGVLLKMIRNLFLIPLLVLFCLTWYMFCIIFFDGFWFLSKIAMFTYSGVIAYPKVSYGYLILAFMSVYYLVESFNAFGESYRRLLKMSIDCCEKLQSRRIIDSDYEDSEFEVLWSRKGISRELFMYIVETCQPKRNQVMLTLLKFSSILTVLTISIELLKTFNKFQELSLLSHVFTVLFICALPKIIRLMCMQGYQHRYRKRLKQNIYRSIAHYVKSKRSWNDDLEDKDLQMSRVGYESLGGEESDLE